MPTLHYKKTKPTSGNGLKPFFNQFKTIELKPGEVILRPDDPLDYIYYLEKGYVSQQVVSENGEDFIINIFRPGAYFPITLAIQDINNDYSFETLTKVTVKKAPTSKVLAFLEENPKATLELIKRLSAGLNSMASKTEALIFGTAKRKIAATLYLTAQRFGETTQPNSTQPNSIKTKSTKTATVINFPLTHKRIASMTGVTRETASIEMMKLKKEGILTYKGKQVTILNMQTLYDTCFCQWEKN